MDVIPLDPSLVRGSHGRLTDDPADGPLFITSRAEMIPDGSVDARSVKRLVLDHVFSDSGSRYQTLKQAG